VTFIELGDQIRPEISQLLESLRPARCALLSGDGKEAVQQVAQKLNFTSWKAECTPLDKREWILAQRSKGEIVCMVGDGINDAPALTAAHVGVSVLSATDMSIQVSDLLLTTDNLTVLAKIRALACKGRRIVSQNLFWAFAYNVVGIFLAALGVLHPLFAAAAMVVSSLMVVFNALRLRKK
jgi:Cu2+-exporting ATPase